jgi:hypothetical protein
VVSTDALIGQTTQIIFCEEKKKDLSRALMASAHYSTANFPPTGKYLRCIQDDAGELARGCVLVVLDDHMVSCRIFTEVRSSFAELFEYHSFMVRLHMGRSWGGCSCV